MMATPHFDATTMKALVKTAGQVARQGACARPDDLKRADGF